MDTFVSLQVFRQIVESGSFVGAADRMQLSPAMVSKHVMNLERQLGARLLNRTSRRLSLTDVGQLYFDKCRVALESLDEAKFLIRDTVSGPRGILHVSVPSWFSDQAFAAALAEYQSRFPQVLLDIHMNTRIADEIEEGIDVSLRVIRGVPRNLKAVRLRRIEFMLVAAPSYLDQTGPLRTAGDLSSLRYVSFPSSDPSQDDQITLEGPDGPETQSIPVSLVANNVTLVCQAAVAGMGLALLPGDVARPEIQAGRLTKVLDHYRHPFLAVYALCSARRYLDPKLKSFVDFVAGNLAEAG